MYLHIGNGVSIKDEDIIGIFDLDSATVSRITKKFINKKQKEIRPLPNLSPFISILLCLCVFTKICWPTGCIRNHILKAWFPTPHD